MGDSKVKSLELSLKNQISNPGITPERKLDILDAALIELNDHVVNMLNTNKDKLDASSYNSFIKNIRDTIKELKNTQQHKIDAAKEDSIDFNNPIIQRGLMYVIQLMVDTMVECGMETKDYLKVVTPRLIGIEDRLNSIVGSVAETFACQSIAQIPEQLQEGSINES